MSTDIKVDAAGACHVTMFVKSISSIERSLDGLEVALRLDAGQRYSYSFNNAQDAQSFFQRLISLMGSSNPQAIATITVHRGARPEGKFTDTSASGEGIPSEVGRVNI